MKSILFSAAAACALFCGCAAFGAGLTVSTTGGTASNLTMYGNTAVAGPIASSSVATFTKTTNSQGILNLGGSDINSFLHVSGPNTFTTIELTPKADNGGTPKSSVIVHSLLSANSLSTSNSQLTTPVGSQVKFPDAATSDAANDKFILDAHGTDGGAMEWWDGSQGTILLYSFDNLNSIFLDGSGDTYINGDVSTSGRNVLSVTQGNGFLFSGSGNGLSIGSGPLIWSSDNSADIGASGATRPRTGYFGTSVVSPSVVGSGFALNADGSVSVANGAATVDTLGNIVTTGDMTSSGTVQGHSVKVTEATASTLAWIGAGFSIGSIAPPATTAFYTLGVTNKGTPAWVLAVSGSQLVANQYMATDGGTNAVSTRNAGNPGWTNLVTPPAAAHTNAVLEKADGSMTSIDLATLISLGGGGSAFPLAATADANFHDIVNVNTLVLTNLGVSTILSNSVDPLDGGSRFIVGAISNNAVANSTLQVTNLIANKATLGSATYNGGPVSYIPTNGSPINLVLNNPTALPLGITNVTGGRAEPVVSFYMIDGSGGVPVMTLSNEVTGMKLIKGKGSLANLTETNFMTLPITSTNAVWRIRDESTGSGASVGVTTNWLVGL